MSRAPRTTPVLLAALWLTLPLVACAQSATAPMDMHGMPDMEMPAAASSTPRPAASAGTKKRRKPAPPAKPRPSPQGTVGMAGMPMPAASAGMEGMDHGAMHGTPMPSKPAGPATPAGDRPEMDHQSMPGMGSRALRGADDRGMPGMNHDAMAAKHRGDAGTLPGMAMGPMQGGNPPPDARSPDYSDGVGYGAMHGMDMTDNAPLGMLLIDRLEGFHGRGANGQAWEVQGWYGNDTNKLWLRTEGRISHGKLDEGDLGAFWNRAIATYWSSQLGLRQDLGEGPERTWAAFGVQGLAPYGFDLEATGYLGAHGRTAARLRANYELLFTQRLILQPEVEANLYGKGDPQRRIGSGVSDVQLGLRLRYEFHRQFAPYIGVNWVRRLGTTAGYARQDHLPMLDRQIVAGVRVWF